MANCVVWVDIPVLDLDRALGFYSAVFGVQLESFDYGGGKLGFFPGQEGGGVSGCLYVADNVKPSADGPLVYFNCDGHLDAAEAAVAANGGIVLESKHAIGPHGFRVLVLDSEGNRVALHSHKA